MSHDLERAFDELADAAAHAAEHGLLAAPSVEPTLHRLVTSVRRRRAVRASAAGVLALAVVVGTAGAVNAGLSGVTPPAVSPTVTPPTPPATSAPAALPTGLQCGATDEYLQTLGDPYRTTNVVGITSPGFPTTNVDGVPAATITVDNIAAEKLDLTDAAPTLVLVRDGVVVGGGALDRGTRGPALAGESTEYEMSHAPTACQADFAQVGSGNNSLEAGQYAAWVVVTATPLGQATAVQNVGGPWALTLVDPYATTPPAAVSVDDVFPCGQVPAVTERTLPDVAGLMLAADIPDQWGADPETWGATLTGADERTVTGQVRVDLRLVFVGADGFVAGRTFSGDDALTRFSVSSGSPAALTGSGEPARCGTGTVGTDLSMPAGTYWAWPYAEVSVESVTHPDGSADTPPAGSRIVVGMPHQVTFAG
jgi:hypothetical protein